ncbi:endo-1,4-beta-xylanase 5-like [Andrographis paniculata]|uniref:endo-1,4-beta-xylanase 5-like n=1 Tax=Andrographis paniculata TaxID=175694 RepID=UPI0021E91D6E|nr:endo-1,4-beta-xylanase 5-like [Andrographis paniculata]
MAAYDRKQPDDSFARGFHLSKDHLYTFSAWLQLSEGRDIVQAFVNTSGPNRLIVGSVVARSGCWSMLKGGFTVDQNMKTQLYFKSNNTKAEIWIDSVSLKGFTRGEWQQHRKTKIDEFRKRRLRIHVTSMGKNLDRVNVTIAQMRTQFAIGCGTTASILDNKDYQTWFVRRFQAATFDNEMKWYYTGASPGKENYTDPDAMVSFFKKHKIDVRGHTILWANPNMTQSWVRSLTASKVREAAKRHVRSVVTRYSHDVIAWDVMNENLHFSFYEDKLGPNASSMFYGMVRSLDSKNPLFLNEYNTLEFPLDSKVIPSRYVERIREIQSFPGNENISLAIGLQGHFSPPPSLSYIRAAIDILSATGLPIWLTELDTRRGPNQAAELEEVMREAFGHPGVEGIIVWGGWKPTNCNRTCLAAEHKTSADRLPHGCAEMCLVDENLRTLPPGDVVDKLLQEWRTTSLSKVTGKDGTVEETVFLGKYSVRFFHPQIPAGRPGKKIVVTPGKDPLEVNVEL